MASESRRRTHAGSRRGLLLAALVLLAPGWLHAQIPAGGAAAAVPAAAERGAPADADPPPANYVLATEDVVHITVWNQQDLSGAFAIESDGTFIFPLLGRIKAAGLTQRDLEGALRGKLAEGFFKRPEVTVAVKEYRRQTVHIVGEVRQPGTYALSGDITIVAALARAGSTTAAAGHIATIVRGRGQKNGPVLPDAAPTQDVVRVDLRTLAEGRAADVLLMDGDTLVVPSAATVYVSGHVKSPGGYAYAPGMTVLQAVALAGGLTDRGAAGRIRIVRITPDGRKEEIKAKLSELVTPGDTIIVPERYF